MVLVGIILSLFIRASRLIDRFQQSLQPQLPGRPSDRRRFAVLSRLSLSHEKEDGPFLIKGSRETRACVL